MNNRKISRPLFLLTAIASTVALLATSCSSPNSAPQGDERAQEKPIAAPKKSPLFDLLAASHTGVGFNNVLKETAEVNFYKYQYLYNGGGVAIGDINNDGLPDLYFTGTQVADKLYLNKGNLQFEDISAASGIDKYQGLKTGVSMADVNADGLLDIYVSRSGWYKDAKQRANLLFINNGDNTFTESAAQYKVNDSGHSVQSVWFDYDKDNDLDLFLTNHPIKFKQTLGERLENQKNPGEDVRDKLYRNDGDSFTEVSREAGIVNYGHGLGPAIGDLNGDSWPDIYIANDFQTHDYYYVNNGDGTFTESIREYFPHTSYFAMGSDIQDINNDGHLDLMVVEMLAADNKRQKTNMAPMNPDLFWNFISRGYHYQYMRNALHLNNGNGHFSDIAHAAGVTQTDWSWASLFADFDNDGLKDLMVTNGYISDTQDKDFSKRTNKLAEKYGGKLTYDQVSELLVSTRLPNFMFRNTNGLQFEDKSDDWGFNFTGYSNGAAYGDLDNDGDLDIVINNFNDPACVYRNKAADRAKNSWLRIRFDGPAGNPLGVGTHVTVKTSEGEQTQELYASRGFESSVEPVLHFGVGTAAIEQVSIVWPDGTSHLLTAVEANTELAIAYTDANNQRNDQAVPTPLFAELNNDKQFVHTENDYDDYEREILIPHQMSKVGPGLAVGDVDGDGRDDYFVCGAMKQASQLYLQKQTGKFSIAPSQPWSSASAAEDIAAHFFDANGDEHLDLYVSAGGNEAAAESQLYQDRLYLGDGKGGFADATKDWVPPLVGSSGAITSGDFDGDGDLDLFVSGRQKPGEYPFPGRSFLLRNDNSHLTDVTEKFAPGLKECGMVTSAVWSDYDSDGKLDLLVTGEWMPIKVFRNTGNNKFEDKTAEMGLDSEVGWWFDLEQADIDNDGDMDYVVGNLGLNYKYQASAEEPFQVWCKDFDESGNLDIVLGYYNQGQCFPVRGRQCSSEQMPFIADKFPTYEAFGEADINQVYGESLNDALHYSATNFASSVLINNNGKLELQALPHSVQFAPIRGIVLRDWNGDGNTDILAAGNLFVAEVETPRADAGVGYLLLGDGTGNFEHLPLTESGFFAKQDVRDVAIANGNSDRPIIIVSNNDGPVQLFEHRPVQPAN